VPVKAFPAHPDDLTARWMTDTLRVSGALSQAEVVTLDTQPMSAEKGMTGYLVRLHPSYDRTEPGAPATLVAKFSGLDAQVRDIVHSMGFYEREVRFYQQLAASTPVQTPRCYFADVDVTDGRSLIILEDLAPARNGSWSGGSSLQDVQLAVTEIAKVHVAWWQSPLLEQHTWLSMTGFMAVSQVQAVFDQTWQNFLGKLSVPVTSEISAVGELLAEHLHAVTAHLLESTPRTLLHHDFDADNLFFGQDAGSPRLSVIDWQLTTGGRAAVDVAWLIGGQCERQLRRESEDQLLHTYHSLLLQNGVADYTFEQCWDDYRLAMLLPAARVACAVGLSPPAPDDRGGFWDVVFPRYCQAITDLDVGELLKTGWRS
jgi:hypothetical protein